MVIQRLSPRETLTKPSVECPVRTAKRANNLFCLKEIDCNDLCNKEGNYGDMGDAIGNGVISLPEKENPEIMSHLHSKP